MRVSVPAVLLTAALSACDAPPGGHARPAATATVGADPLAADDDAPGQAEPDAADRGGMRMQVVLDLLGFTPCVIDGRDGVSTRNATAGFQEANGMPVTGAADAAAVKALGRWQGIAATRPVTIPADFAAGPFRPIPRGPAEQARFPALGDALLDEKLAERFHTTPATFKALNPDVAGAVAQARPSAALPEARFAAGQAIRARNVGNDVVDGGALDDADWRETVVSLGVGSSPEPLPLGRWRVPGTAHNPRFHDNPDLFRDASSKDTRAQLPVGLVSIDLGKPHCGIHGTPEPRTIGRTQSHGCVRLTNRDAARLAQMVSPATRVLFQA